MSDDLPRFDPERDTEWRERLTEMQYHITREAGTEPPNSGIHYMEDRKGDYPKAGDKVKVHYTGTLEDGTKFDSSRDRNKPFEFTIGVGQVIKGWDEGLSNMRPGGQRKLIIPSELGYGERGAGKLIPPGACLLYTSPSPRDRQKSRMPSSA